MDKPFTADLKELEIKIKEDESDWSNKYSDYALFH
jgi:hypothetical protein